MNGWDDFGTEQAWEERKARRRRWTSLLRGWLRKKRAPRLTVLLVVAVCAAVACLADFWMKRMGVEMRPMRWAYAVIPTWPLFVFLVRWRAGVESRQFDFEQLGEALIALDERAEASFSKPLLSDEMHEGIAAGLRSGMQQGGGGSLFLGMILAAVTLGGWLVWELVRGGPRLLADTMIDAEFARLHPAIFEKVVTYPWMAELFGATAIQFVGLAIAAFFLGLSWPLDFL